MRNFLLLSLLHVLIVNTVFACDCLRTESFCETIYNDATSGNKDTRVVHAVLTEKTANQLDFKIKETLSGEFANGKIFYFEKGQIFEFDGFVIGKEYIFHLIQPLSKPQFHYHFCGTQYLPIENNKVVGFIQQGIYEMPLKEFLDLPNCGVSIPSLELTPTLLTDNSLFLTPTNWPHPAPLEFTILNSIGQLIFKQKIEELQGEQPVTIELKELSSGMYYCRLAYLGREQMEKILVLRGFVWVNIYHIVTPRFNEGSMSSLSHIYLLF